MFTTLCLLSLYMFPPKDTTVEISPLTSEYVTPVRIVQKQGNVGDADLLLKKGTGQAVLGNVPELIMANPAGNQGPKASVLLDFGKEMQGGVEIITGASAGNRPINVHVCFGESVSEALSLVNTKGASNDHAMRDYTVALPWLGKAKVGNTGFRFLRVDLDETAVLKIKEIRAVSTYRNAPVRGSFTSSDARLNEIWKTGAYTVQLNMQDYLWDGIKRDRLVWVGDMHPEVSTINAVFGYNDIVPKSLDLSRDITPLPGWMNGISTYSMWWIIIQHDWFLYNGDENYLKQQQPYLSKLVKQIVAKVGSDNQENMDGWRFLDWPSSDNLPALHAGMQGLTVWSLSEAAELANALGDTATERLATVTVNRMKGVMPDTYKSKQAAALLSIAGIMPSDKAYQDVLSIGGAANFSTFYGYYMLMAMAKAEKYQEAMNIIRQYWGGMLDLGATTFWEDFDMDWLKNAGRIDQLVPAGKVDVHASYGKYCYKEFRHSLCHGWSSGATAWLSRYVLGVEPLEPGCKKVRITPHLGDLTWVEGTFPIPQGVIEIRHEKQEDGSIKSKIKVPKGVKVVK